MEETLALLGRQRPRRKNRPGEFTNTEMVELVQFGSQWDIFQMPHYLSGYVLEDQVECSSLERTDVYLFRGWPQPSSGSAQYRPTGSPIQAYWLTFFSLRLFLGTILSLGEGG